MTPEERLANRRVRALHRGCNMLMRAADMLANGSGLDPIVSGLRLPLPGRLPPQPLPPDMLPPFAPQAGETLEDRILRLAHERPDGLKLAIIAKMVEGPPAEVLAALRRLRAAKLMRGGRHKRWRLAAQIAAEHMREADLAAGRPARRSGAHRDCPRLIAHAAAQLPRSWPFSARFAVARRAVRLRLPVGEVARRIVMAYFDRENAVENLLVARTKAENAMGRLAGRGREGPS